MEKDWCSDDFPSKAATSHLSLAADQKSSLDLVQLSFDHLIKHCEANKEQLKEIDNSILAIDTKTKLEMYLVQLPAIVAGYLNLQIPKPSDPAKLRQLNERIRAVLQEQYADRMQTIELCEPVLESDATLFESLLLQANMLYLKEPKVFLSQLAMKSIDTLEWELFICSRSLT